MEKNIYKEFILSGNGQALGISHIQYADDMVLVGDLSLSNVRALKCILRNFELVAKLNVNFHKSGLFGIKADQRVLLNKQQIYCIAKLGICRSNFLEFWLGQIKGGRRLGIR